MKKIDIGVAADRSLSTVFEPLIAASARARVALKKDADAEAAALEAASKKAAAAAAKAFAQMEAMSAKDAAAEIASADKAAQAKIKASQRAFDAELKEVEKRIALAKKAADAEEREIMRTAAAAEKADARKLAAAEKATQKAREKAGARAVSVGRDAMETFGGVARAGIGIGGEMLRGAGVNLDLSSSVSRSVSLESTAARATSSAATAQGRVASPEEIKSTIDAIRSAGVETALDFGKLASGLEDFVSKSSDLNTGKKILAELGATARATGTDVDKLISAAGDVNKTLEDSPDKAERLLSIMRLVAKQGALGNVEVKDLALYMGKLTASAFMYEGSRDTNIGTLGALAQISMRGGATTAAEGTRAAGSFARDITKGAAAKRFEAAGIELYADEAKTKLRDPEKIITDYYAKSGGSLSELAKLFQNEMSKKVILGFGTVAEDAKRQGRDPVEAIHAEFARFRETLTHEDVMSAASVSKGTTEGRAQAFQNQLDLIVASLAERVLPAMEELAPKALEVANALGKVVGWAAENPGHAIVAAIVGSIGKAAIGNMVGTALENALKTAGAAAGGKGLGLAIGAATIGITAGSILVAKLQEDVGKGREAATGQIATNEAVLSKAEKEFKETGTLSPETVAELQRQRGVVEGQIKEGQAAPSAESTKGLGGIPMFLKDLFGVESYEQQGRKAGARDSMGQLTGEAKGIDALLSAVNDLKAATVANKPPKSVTVDNMPGAIGPVAGAGTSNTGAPAVSGRR
jgi:hypothetical protein